ncbi:MAG: Hpt domain-containing protein [Desulfuromonadaceae bacterium]|nr:Hpt domain-containing protein [Desulfuromonadaceae bacterium]MDD5105438.1 Hpt domain-containing protein [Desulfuromonadaceae bacterium]
MTPSIPSATDGIANLPEELPGIVILNGLKMCNYKQPLYRELLIKFLNSKRCEADEIRLLLTSGDRDTAGRKAHSMKSVSGILGADSLSETARQLEETINSGADNLLHTHLESFEDALKSVINGLDAAFGAETDESMEERRRQSSV